MDAGKRREIERANLYKEMKRKGVKLVRVLTTTSTYVRRIKLIPLDVFFADVLDGGVAIAKPLLLLPYYGDVIVEGAVSDVSGEYLNIPDLSTLKQLPYNPKQAFVHGNLVTKELEPALDLCPRTVLQEAVRRAKEEFGIDIMVGFETEFVILKDFETSGDQFIPLDDHLYSEANGTYRINDFFEEVNDVLSELDIEVLALHCEAGLGMFEVPTGVGDAVGGADKLVLTREVLYELAAKRGWKLTLCPKIYDDRSGNGQHVHMSIWKDGKNLVPDDSPDSKYFIGPVAQQFIAGILKHLGGLSMLLQPSANSFRRVQMHFVCGSFNCWAHDNRDAALRVCEGISKVKGAKHCSNFEIKCVDGTCNPYYAVAALITAGLEGLRNKLELPPPLVGDPEAQKIPSLPIEFEDAAKQFAQDSVLKDLFGDNLARFLAVRKAEQLYFKDKSVEQCKRETILHF